MEPQPTQTRRSPDSIARIVAVLALLAGAIVVVVVIASSTGGSDGSEQGQGGRGAGQGQRESYCVVRPGDTFAAIAVQARVPETRLAELNPNLDQFSIQPENCVNLVPKGCKELSGGGPPTPCT
ncbi:MAG: LysM domain-containing protein [Actinomycetota bacterium]